MCHRVPVKRTRLSHPPYSPDLAPADFSLPKMKTLRIFESRNSLKSKVNRVVLCELPEEVFSEAVTSILLR